MMKQTFAAMAIVFAVTAVPAFAAEHNGGSHEGHAGLGIGLSGAGHTRDEHRAFHMQMDPEDQTYISTVCAIPYKHRTTEEKDYCEDIRS